MILKVKKLTETAKLPVYATDGSSGMDVFASKPAFVHPGSAELVPLGIAVEIPVGFELQVRPRSGLALKHRVTVLNAPGTIDSDYRGELAVQLVNHSHKFFNVECGDRIAQLVFCPVVRAIVEEVQQLNETQRGNGGFGSTGR